MKVKEEEGAKSWEGEGDCGGEWCQREEEEGGRKDSRQEQRGREKGKEIGEWHSVKAGYGREAKVAAGVTPEELEKKGKGINAQG